MINVSDLEQIKLNFKVVFTCTKKQSRGVYMRTFINIWNIEKWVGPENALDAITRALCSSGQKYTARYRNTGRLDFYRK